MSQRPKWVSCDGGPHLLLPAELVPLWHPHRDRATDYERACAIAADVGIVSVGDGYGLVINDEVPMTGWIAASESHGFLVVPMYWEDAGESFHSRAVSACLDMPESEFSSSGLSVTADAHGFLLFTACDEAPDWDYSTAHVQLNRGVYDVARAAYASDEYEARVYRLQLRVA
jgi:hypothetical protein